MAEKTYRKNVLQNRTNKLANIQENLVIDFFKTTLYSSHFMNFLFNIFLVRHRFFFVEVNSRREEEEKSLKMRKFFWQKLDENLEPSDTWNEMQNEMASNSG